MSIVKSNFLGLGLGYRLVKAGAQRGTATPPPARTVRRQPAAEPAAEPAAQSVGQLRASSELLRRGIPPRKMGWLL
jgi:hypothetical protein